jgi:hypothetical protein
VQQKTISLNAIVHSKAFDQSVWGEGEDEEEEEDIVMMMRRRRRRIFMMTMMMRRRRRNLLWWWWWWIGGGGGEEWWWWEGDDDDDDCREQMVFVTWLHVRLCSLVRLCQGFPLFLYVIALRCQCDRGNACDLSRSRWRLSSRSVTCSGSVNSVRL